MTRRKGPQKQGQKLSQSQPEKQLQQEEKPENVSQTQQVPQPPKPQTEEKTLTLDDIKRMEEEERLRRITELATHTIPPLKQDDHSWSWEKAVQERKRGLARTAKLEEDERAIRLTGLARQFYQYKIEQREKYLQDRGDITPSLNAPYPLVSHATIKAHVIVQEEEERARRIAEDSYLEEVEKERSATNRAYSRIAEEQEKLRRVSENEYLDNLEKERSLTNRALSRIEEEEEKLRRVSEEEHLQAVEEQNRQKLKEDVLVAEEEERKRRLSELETKTRADMSKQIQTEQQKLHQQVQTQIVSHDEGSKQRE
jgi:hypothetical protein